MHVKQRQRVAHDVGATSTPRRWRARRGSRRSRGAAAPRPWAGRWCPRCRRSAPGRRRPVPAGGRPHRRRAPVDRDPARGRRIPPAARVGAASTAAGRQSPRMCSSSRLPGLGVDGDRRHARDQCRHRRHRRWRSSFRPTPRPARNRPAGRPDAAADPASWAWVSLVIADAQGGSIRRVPELRETALLGATFADPGVGCRAGRPRRR